MFDVILLPSFTWTLAELGQSLHGTFLDFAAAGNESGYFNTAGGWRWGIPTAQPQEGQNCSDDQPLRTGEAIWSLLVKTDQIHVKVWAEHEESRSSCFLVTLPTITVIWGMFVRHTQIMEMQLLLLSCSVIKIRRSTPGTENMCFKCGGGLYTHLLHETR